MQGSFKCEEAILTCLIECFALPWNFQTALRTFHAYNSGSRDIIDFFFKSVHVTDLVFVAKYI